MALLEKLSEVGSSELLTTMHTQTAKIAKEGFNKINRLHNASVLLCIEMGCQIDRLTDNEGIEDGASHEVTKLADYWGMSNNQLYAWRNTAAAFCKSKDEETGKFIYDKSFITEQISTPMDNGMPLTFEHFKSLARLRSDKKKETLLEQTRKNGWSAGELSGEIDGSGLSLTTARSGGRKPAVPSTAPQYVRKTYTQAQKLNNFLEASESDVLNMFEEVPADIANDRFIEKIDAAVGELDGLPEITHRIKNILLDGRERIVNVMKNTIEHVKSTEQPWYANKSDNAETKDEDDYVTGTQMAAKIREIAKPKKKAAKKQLRPRKSKK